MTGKDKDGFLDLQGIGLVFSVKNDDVITFRMQETEITGAWLGTWLTGGNRHNPEMERQIHRMDSITRLRIILLDQKKDLQPIGGIIQRFHRCYKLRNDSCFMIEWTEN